ncbi:hypothetical protein [Mycolicibacterium sp. S3B2]|uniref:hypothetical protein n=1 Tax=Mycolicibacterium sp. S3B2 TaxID=3415120 RepID=UPI003C7D6E01
MPDHAHGCHRRRHEGLDAESTTTQQSVTTQWSQPLTDSGEALLDYAGLFHSST